MTIYDDLRTVALDVFGEFKQGVIQYVELTPAPGSTPDDPLDPVVTRHTINSTARPVSTKYVDGSNIVQSDRQVAMPNTGVEPSLDGYVTIDGSDYKIIEVMPRPSAGVPVVFILIVRR